MLARQLWACQQLQQMDCSQHARVSTLDCHAHHARCLRYWPCRITLPVATEPDAAEAWWDDGSCSSSLSTPTTPTVPDGPEVPLAGRRARTAGSRSSKGSSLNVERYMYCLEVQKRAVGGVLASSSTDPAWDGTAVTSPQSQQPSSFTASSTPFSSSKSIWQEGGYVCRSS
jgi:hypothetical protein